MFAVLFEVQPKPGQWDRYLELAGTLRPELIEVPGFVDNERFASQRTEGRLLSLSTWEDEKALIRWRTHAMHHEVQREGRFEVFADYQLRVGEVVSDSDADELPQTRFDVTEAGAATAATISETPPGRPAPSAPTPSADLVDAELYTGITTEGKHLMLASWRSATAAGAWVAEQPAGARHRHVRIVRDYGMHRREEAPQYYAPVG
jgi:heme-degrading monooxygenase HmoA